VLREVNIENGKIIREGVINSLNTNGLFLNRSMIYDGCIYFAGNNGEMMWNNTIGVLDFSSLRLLWSSVIPFSNRKSRQGNFLMPLTNTMEDKFYAIDKYYTLYVYQKIQGHQNPISTEFGLEDFTYSKQREFEPPEEGMPF
jgi:hypothetical protein